MAEASIAAAQVATINQTPGYAKPHQPVNLQVTPFQQFLDHAVQAFVSLSAMEFQTNQLIKKYMKGKVSVDEVTIATGKLNLAMQMATTVVTTSVQTFKELQQIPL